MEHNIIQNWLYSRGIIPPPSVIDKLELYARLILEASSRFNITGLTTLESIIVNLVLGSIEPVNALRVSRGTRFADIGSGAGIPGVPICILFPEFFGTFIESNRKKSDFIHDVAGRLCLENVSVVNKRAEDALSDSSFRDVFPYCFSRACSPLYSSLELCIPFLRPGGLFYFYSHPLPHPLPEGIISHAYRLGASPVHPCDYNSHGFSGSGALFIKTEPTDSRFPRRFSVIKREAEKHLLP